MMQFLGLSDFFKKDNRLKLKQFYFWLTCNQNEENLNHVIY